MVWASLFNRAVHARRPMRRLLILGAFAGYPLVLIGYATLVAPHRLDMPYWGPIVVLLMAVSAIGLATIYLYVRDRAALDSARLDERQRALTSRAHVLSYGVLATVSVLLIGALAAYLSLSGPLTLRMEDVAPWLVAVGVYLPVLPSAVLAWIEPDDLDDEAGR